jgi:hypothetical protein
VEAVELADDEGKLEIDDRQEEDENEGDDGGDDDDEDDDDIRLISYYRYISTYVCLIPS